jgi:hypothetical protein
MKRITLTVDRPGLYLSKGHRELKIAQMSGNAG